MLVNTVVFAPVQSVTRALKVLATINRSGLISVSELHRLTEIPKPTIVRFLQTLIAAGYVAHDKKTRGYHVTSAVAELSTGFHGAPAIIEVARPIATELTREIVWPCAVCTLDLDAVVVNYSTIANSPISPFHASLGRRLSLGGRALGRAYIFFCPDRERQILRNVMRESTDPENSEVDDAAFDQMLEKAHSVGYAERDHKLAPNNSNTIAFPIMAADRVVATFGVTYFRSAVKRTLDREQIINATRNAVDQIEKRCNLDRILVPPLTA